MPEIAIVINCGIGDAHTYLARLPALCLEKNIKQVDFYIDGGHRDIPDKIEELLNASHYVHTVHTNKSSTKAHGLEYKEVLDWRPDDAPLKYGIQYPFFTSYHKEDLQERTSFLKDIPFPIVVQPYSTGGNARGEAEKILRSAEESWWVNVLSRLKGLGATPIVVGAEYDAVDWAELGVDVDVFYGEFMPTIPLILHSSAFIGTNSWCWQVAYYAGIRTSCLYIHPQQHLKLHLAKQNDNLTIFKEKPTVDNAVESLCIPVMVYYYDIYKT